MTNGVDDRLEVELIEMDDTSKDIFGEDGLAELNDALRQLSNIKAGHIATTKGTMYYVSTTCVYALYSQ